MKEFFDKIFSFDEKNPYITTAILGVVLELIIECFNQRAILGGFQFLISNPLMFLTNALIIIASLSLALLFHKRRFLILLITIAWMTLTITNFIIRTFRTTPLRAIDFRVAKSVVSIVDMYLSVGLIIVLAVVVLAALAALILLLIKSKWIRPKYLKAVAAIILSVVLAFGSLELSSATGALPDHFDNLTNAYTDNGFIYCFLASIFDNGIAKPETYSEDNICRIINENTDKGKSSGKKPNIVYVQLESFFDVAKLKNFTYSEDPIPCFNELKSKCAHGKLTVASFGTGTANTEFDVLTSLNVQFFGAGEYPYSTVLRKRTCESMPYVLKDLGYSTHAIHNHQGNFYARNKVYPRLGFDTFMSIEYMNDVELNVLGWAKDKILTKEILDTLESTDERDFIFTVSVQPHGRYSEEVVDPNQTITLEGAKDEGEKNAYEYYINQLHETDAFVGELVETLENYKEPTVVVFYGDHLPNIGMSDSDLIDGVSVYDSEYVIWSNYGQKFKSKDLATYQLSAYIYNTLGFKDWVIASLHKNSDYDLTNTDYLRDLKMIQYDILYGDRYFYGEDGPRKSAEMTMGMLPVIIDQIIQESGGVRIYGENFTDCSTIAVGDDKMDTQFISTTELFAEGVNLEVGDKVRVMQLAGGKTSLSRSQDIYYLLGPEDVINAAKSNEKDAGRFAAGHSRVSKQKKTE